MSFWTAAEKDAKLIGSKVLHAMRFAEEFFGSQAGVQKLQTVEQVIAAGLEMAGVPPVLVQAGNAEFQVVVNAIVAWDKKLNGAILGPSGSAPAASAKAA